MTMQLNKNGYIELIQGNIEELEKHMPEHSLEKKHTIEVLKWSVEQIYGKDIDSTDIVEVKSIDGEINAFKEWTQVTRFLSTGLVGIKVRELK